MKGTATGAGGRGVSAARLLTHGLVLGIVLWCAGCASKPHDPRQPAPCGTLPNMFEFRRKFFGIRRGHLPHLKINLRFDLTPCLIFAT
jgi:hypothetical protein